MGNCWVSTRGLSFSKGHSSWCARNISGEKGRERLRGGSREDGGLTRVQEPGPETGLLPLSLRLSQFQRAFLLYTLHYKSICACMYTCVRTHTCMKRVCTDVCLYRYVHTDARIDARVCTIFTRVCASALTHMYVHMRRQDFPNDAVVLSGLRKDNGRTAKPARSECKTPCPLGRWPTAQPSAWFSPACLWKRDSEYRGLLPQLGSGRSEQGPRLGTILPGVVEAL